MTVPVERATRPIYAEWKPRRIQSAENLADSWLTYLPDDDDQTPLRKVINELARNVSHVH